MSINTIATLSGISRGGRLPAVGAEGAHAPAADPGPDLDLGLDADLFGGDDLFAAPVRSNGLTGPGQAAATLPDKDESGSVTGTAAVAASGNQGIDGLLSGVRWNGGSITYSFPDSAADYQAGHPEAFTCAQQINAAQMMAAHFALSDVAYTQPAAAVGFSVAGMTGLNIAWTSVESAGTIRLLNTFNPGTAYAYYPNGGVAGGDAFFGNSGRTPVMGNYHWHTMLHEIGHALGLKHGQDASAGHGAMPSGLDSMEYSVMAYRSYVNDPLIGGYSNETYGYAQTYMMYDIAALQYMYGADFTTNSGNTIYSWTPGSGNTVINGSAAITPGANRIFMTIWDGGGTDTYDASAYTTAVTINLAPGGHSLLSGTQRAYLGDGNHARGNVFNALPYNGDARSLIENATGGSGSDTLYGNAASNALTGKAGDDYLWTGRGNDTLRGGTGADSVYGHDGNDRVHSGDGNTIDAVQDGGNGTDVLWYGYFGLSGYTFDMAAGQIRLGATVLGTMANFETLHGGYGNDIIVSDGSGHACYGNGGNDAMFAGLGTETMYGGAGIDTANMTLFDDGHLYNMNTGLTNRAGERYLEFERVVMGDGNDTVIGTAGNEVIAGGLGNDRMEGGGGNDSYHVNSLSDLVVEAAGGGVDWVNAWVNLTLGSNVENLQLRGAALVGTGNLLSNIINGTAGNNILHGGGGGADTLRGCGGDDTYQVGAGDIVIEAVGQGTDTVRSWAAHTLAANVENLTLAGGAAINGTGNGLDNLISGNGAANVLIGAGGNDIVIGNNGNDRLHGGIANDRLFGGTGADRLDGGLGADTLTGAPDADLFIYGAGADLITDFADDLDTLALDDALWGGAALTINQVLALASVVAGDTIFNFGGGNTLVVDNIANKVLLADDLVFV